METISGPYVYPEQGSSGCLFNSKKLNMSGCKKNDLTCCCRFPPWLFPDRIDGIWKANSGRRYAFLRNSDSWTLDCHENSAA